MYRLHQNDPFQREKEFIYRSIKPNLVSLEFDKEWEQRRNRIYEIMKQFDEQENALKLQSNNNDTKESENLIRNPENEENDKNFYRCSNPAEFAPVNSGETFEVPE